MVKNGKTYKKGLNFQKKDKIVGVFQKKGVKFFLKYVFLILRSPKNVHFHFKKIYFMYSLISF